MFLLAVAGALLVAGCVAPPEPEEDLQSSNVEAPADATTGPRAIELPPEPEFHPGAVLDSFAGEDNLSAIEVVNDRYGSVYVAPSPDGAWNVEVGIVSLGPTCSPQNGADLFDVAVGVEQGLLTVHVTRIQGGMTVLPFKQDDHWVDVKVFAPDSVSVVHVTEERSSNPQSSGPIILGQSNVRMCPDRGWGYAAHGMDLERLGMSMDDMPASIVGVRVTDAVLHLDDSDGEILESDFASLEFHVDAGSLGIKNSTVNRIDGDVDDGLVGLKDVTIGTGRIQADDGSIQLKGVRGVALELEVDDGTIAGKDIAVDTLTLVTDDGEVLMTLAVDARSTIRAKTDDGMISIRVPASADHGVAIDARSEDGKVRVEVPDFEAETSEPNHVRGETKGIDSRRYVNTITAEADDGTIAITADE